jgi:hypothetical protein
MAGGWQLTPGPGFVRTRQGLRYAGERAVQYPRELVASESARILEILRGLSPGGLAAAWSRELRMRGPVAEARFLNAHPAARFVIEGTGIYHRPEPHSPWTVAGKLQVFEWRGATVFTMRTRHLGQRANPLVDKARALAAQGVTRVLQLKAQEFGVTIHRGGS